MACVEAGIITISVGWALQTTIGWMWSSIWKSNENSFNFCRIHADLRALCIHAVGSYYIIFCRWKGIYSVDSYSSPGAKDDSVSFKKFGWEGEADARYVRYQAMADSLYKDGIQFVDEIIVK